MAYACLKTRNRHEVSAMSIPFISHVHSLSQRAQHRYWAGHSPWEHEGKRVKLASTQSLGRSDVSIDDHGHVVRLGHFLLRPCFGSPTAFLIHGGDQFTKTRKGNFPTRCNNCPAKEACAKVATARLERVSQPIRDALTAWNLVGGRKEMKSERKSGQFGQASHRWRDLLAALDNHGRFKSINDDYIRDYCNAKVEEQRVKDRDRKQAIRDQERLARFRCGDFDTAFLERMWREAFHRRVLFNQARERDGAPPWLRTRDVGLPQFTADVWRVMTMLEIGQKKPNASLVASELIALDLVESRNHNSLRGRVKSAIDRVRRLETVTLPGRDRPTWDRVDLVELTVVAP